MAKKIIERRKRVEIRKNDKKPTLLDEKDVSIWNINSFAEFYMQIEEKYKKDYHEGLKKIRQERKRFESEIGRAHV